MKNFVCVYDFETDGQNPNKCEPVQIAACMMNPTTLEIVSDSEFTSYMKPKGIDEEGYLDNDQRSFQGKKVKDTVSWHARNYNEGYDELSAKEKKIADEAIVQKWRDAPDPKQVWGDFVTYLLKYNKNQSRRTFFSAPIRAGMNIRKFDNVIVYRMCERFGYLTKDGEQKIFYPRDVIDLMEIAFYWFENLPEPKAYNMEELRRFFGMPQHGAHDALNDVRDEVLLIQKFLKLHRQMATRVKFKNALQNASL